MTDPNYAEPLSAWWMRLFLRLLSCARMGRTVIVTMRVVCIDGEPRFWARPDMMPVEPAASAEAFDEFLGQLSGSGGEGT